jgi:hypothetical protein
MLMALKQTIRYLAKYHAVAHTVQREIILILLMQRIKECECEVASSGIMFMPKFKYLLYIRTEDTQPF